MSAVPAGPRAERSGAPRLLGFFDEARVQAYGYTLAIIYAVLLTKFYWVGAWIIDRAGAPAYTDFTTMWVAGIEALRGHAAGLYDSATFVKLQTALLGPQKFLYPNWPYPPSVLLIAVPFGALPYRDAFLAWNFLTLAALVAVAWLIVRRPPAIAVVLASPFTAWNFMCGQNGFLTGSLFGAALLCLEERPILAGMFIGCLTCKPQFGLLFPVALLAARQWRAIASAAVTAAALAGLSIAAFGARAWEMLPHALLEQQKVVLLAGGQAAGADWGRLQTIYGLVRQLHGNGVLAVSLQGLSALVLAAIVWLVWRSSVRHGLKAATLSAAALIATPYAFSYDMAALAIPVAFLADDQLRHGLLRGEQTTLLALFAAIVAALFGFGDSPGRTTFGSVPLGQFAVIVLLVLILRRVLSAGTQPSRNFSRARVFALAARESEGAQAGAASHG